MVYDFRPKPEGSRLIPAKQQEIQAESGYKNFEVIYSGISDTAMQFTYREFTPDNMARPAFFQDLTYSLGSKSLRFRGFKIQVLSASNESIRFIVEEDDL